MPNPATFVCHMFGDEADTGRGLFWKLCTGGGGRVKFGFDRIRDAAHFLTRRRISYAEAMDYLASLVHQHLA